MPSILLFLIIYLSLLLFISSFAPFQNAALTTTKKPFQRTIYQHNRNKLYGIPKLFSWLVNKYPNVKQSLGEGLFARNSLPVDNFYLDMNGIIHACTHANEDKKLVKLNEKEMFQRIFTYTDSLYKLIRPQKTMFIAIDGVAPRAKLNQQRSRRFRSAKEQELLIEDYVTQYGKLPHDEQFDSNCITPGTEFMFNLAQYTKQWIEKKMETDSFWKHGAEIVFSGPDVPGEGEHKIMDMIRSQQNSYNKYKQRRNSQQRHCMYGLDSDLIMLSLISQEKDFFLLREKNQKKHSTRNSIDDGLLTAKDFDVVEISAMRNIIDTHFSSMKIKLELIEKHYENVSQPLKNSKTDLKINNQSVVNTTATNVPITDSSTATQKPKSVKLEPYIKHSSLPLKFDIKRIINDFVFICILVGNDFLPHIPNLTIENGGLSLLLSAYEKLLPELGGYITDGCKIHIRRLELLFSQISLSEPLYFEQKAVEEVDDVYKTDDYKQHYYNLKFGMSNAYMESLIEKNLVEINTENVTEFGDITLSSTVPMEELQNPSSKHNVRTYVQCYIEGLHWVLNYYKRGVPSWGWYYPFLYAPVASDFKNLTEINVTIPVGKPYTSFAQLLSVLPPLSKSLLPECYSRLMSHPNSHISEYFPDDFVIDCNGRDEWAGVVHIPFISEYKLRKSLATINYDHEISNAEKLRDKPGNVYVYRPKFLSSKLLSDIHSNSSSGSTYDVRHGNKIILDYFSQQKGENTKNK